MSDRTANLLGALGLAISDRIAQTGREVMNREGETPAALVVIGYETGPSNDQLRRILGLSHPGTVRLIDRLVSDGLVERRPGIDKRAVALFLTDEGHSKREELLANRLAAIGSVLNDLNHAEREALDSVLEKLLLSIGKSDLDRRRLCRLCDNRVCLDCPIPADFQRS